ncbi:shikimate kinase [Alicyclobacillus mengziensis]|uniref:Shikimate kinase n=1 Tax=Alicyclobacillus mengziensis TaxID=2931921 RepID=A0A9X7VWP0_9BACL|nr:shikimate kinase [Alicyclobacillus mengziensis]QSO45897.1 shikimate kinase [Alicyclobacillus mengziensis]
MTRVALVGPMGVGKSTVARLLAVGLGWRMVDLDSEIEQRSGKTVRQIFESETEQGFRMLESSTLDLVTKETVKGCCVLATGGGVVTTSVSREILFRDWETVWLTASPATMIQHLQFETSGRPLLDGAKDLFERIHKLSTDRAPLYQSVAKWTVSVDGLTAETVAQRIHELGGWTACNE